MDKIDLKIKINRIKEIVIDKIKIVENRTISIGKAIYYRCIDRFRLFRARKSEYTGVIGKVTIITPTYNRPDILIERAFKSVLSQTYKNWEWLIIGDGCNEETIEKIINIYENESRISIYNIPRKRPEHQYDSLKSWYIGGLHARNYALKNLKLGEYIAVLDDDDIWHPEKLQVCIDAIRKLNVEFLCSAHMENLNGRMKVNYGVEANSYFYKKKYKIPNQKISPRIGAHSSIFYKSYLKCFKYNKDCWRKQWNKVEETDLLYRMWKAKIKMGFVARPLLKIIPRPNEKNIGMLAVKDNIMKRKYKYFYDKIKTIDKILNGGEKENENVGNS